MALQHDCVFDFHPYPPVQPTRVLSLGYPLTLVVCIMPVALSPSLSVYSFCVCSESVSSPLVSSISPRDILKTSLLIIPRTSGWEECLAPGSPPSTLSILSPTTRSPLLWDPHGHSRHLFIKVGSFGLLVVASLFPCPSLPSNLPFKFSSAYMLLFRLLLLPLKYSFYSFHLPFLFLLFLIFLFQKKWWYTPLSTRFHHLHSLTLAHSTNLHHTLSHIPHPHFS